jgi:hypothetical protein
MLSMTELKKKAKKLNISAATMNKVDLIRAIQTAEGNFPCFKTAMDGSCDQGDCSWRDDCLRK